MRGVLLVIGVLSVVCVSDTDGTQGEDSRGLLSNPEGRHFPSHSVGKRYSEEQSNKHREFFLRSGYADDGDSGRGGRASSAHDGRQANEVEKFPYTQGNKYGPKEDPREYYKSDGYIQKILARGKPKVRVREMSSVYPQLEPQLARSVLKASLLRTPEIISRYTETNWKLATDEDDGLCLKCPPDRTLVMRKGVNRVLFQAPSIKTCSGGKAPPGTRFVTSQGPELGTLLSIGSYSVEGRIDYNGEYVERCRMAVGVVRARRCPLSRRLRAACDAVRCNFTCSDPSLQLHGSRTLTCGDDSRWSGELPVCRVRTWCHMPPPLDHGVLSCQSAPAWNGVKEGARCKASCQPGWRAVPRSSVCRRGTWTAKLVCKKRRPPHAHSHQG